MIQFRVGLFAGAAAGWLLLSPGSSARALTVTHLPSDAAAAVVLPAANVASQAEGRIGDLEGAAVYETALGPTTAAPETTGQFAWPNGVPQDFSMHYEPENNTVFFYVGVQLLTYQPSRGFKDLFLRTSATKDGTSIVLDNLEYNWVPVGDVSSAVGPTGLDILWIGDGAPDVGFCITGQVTMTWDPVDPPQGSDLAFQLTLGTPEGCQTDVQCDDFDGCTADACVDHLCVNTPVCPACSVAADCDDHDACTTDACDGGECTHTAEPGCMICASDGECSDGNGCSSDVCVEGACQHVTTPGCVPCATAAACGDANACTTDVCNVDGVCEHQTNGECVPCETTAECDDGNPCTSEQCGEDGSCVVTAIPGCRTCETAASCDDGDPCTLDRCGGLQSTPEQRSAAAVCTHVRDAACGSCTPTTELCGNDQDDDCDGAADCADPNCAAAPACQAGEAEVCGDCIDNDGDGLVDFEDPDCCADEVSLGVTRLQLRPGAEQTRRARIVLRGAARMVRVGESASQSLLTPLHIDPATHDTTLQFSDARGQVYCRTVKARDWKHPRPPLFRFTDRPKGREFGQGFWKGRVKLVDGQMKVRFRGRRMGLRKITGETVNVTVRVGGACVHTTAPLPVHPARNSSVFP